MFGLFEGELRFALHGGVVSYLNNDASEGSPGFSNLQCVGRFGFDQRLRGRRSSVSSGRRLAIAQRL